MPAYAVIVGTLGKSPVIDRLADKGIIDRGKLEGKWESFLIKTADSPIPGVTKALIIAGSDRRGTVYGIYELSRQIGVSPWYWWLDVPIKQRDKLLISDIDFSSGEPSVKYRGIFINDEFPSMTAWAKAKFGGMNSRMYSKIYELLLRLRANTLWPGMWGSFKAYRPMEPIFKDQFGLYEGNCFNEDDPDNPRVADEYGIIIGTSHHEPMQRSQQEWIRHKSEYGNGQWNYLKNRKGIEKFFREGIRNCRNFDNIVTIGMRGDEDRPMDNAGTPEENFRLMKLIIKRQRTIIAEETGKDASAMPQVWTLYSEVLDYFDQGLEVPEDVIIMFCDDNFGNVRRLPNPDKKRHKGGYGMYYHVSYYGAPRACKWLNTTQIQHMCEQLRLSFDYGIDKMWILNVGDLKPHEFTTDYFLESAWSADRLDYDKLTDYTRGFCASIFGQQYSADAARLLDNYNKYAAWINPELLDQNTYSLDNGEFDMVLNSWLALEAQAARLEKDLPADCGDAYRQLLGYPIEAMANLHDLYYNLARHTHALQQGDLCADEWARKARQSFRRDSLLTYEYNHITSGGKWEHMMDQPHIGYKDWHDPQCNIMPSLKDNSNVESSSRHFIFLKKDNSELIMDADHYHSSNAYGGREWKKLENLGRWRDGVTLYPAIENPDHDDLIFRFNLNTPMPSAYVTIITKSTMPFLEGGHKANISIDGNPPDTIDLNSNLNWEHKYDLMYPTGASRVIVKQTSAGQTLAAGEHTLRIAPLSPGIVFYKIIVHDGCFTPGRILLPESTWTLSHSRK